MNDLTKNVIEWTKNYLGNNKVVIGISGGKDSSVAAAVCVAAVGKENVIGVELPNCIQTDISDSDRLIEHLGIQKKVINIGKAYNGLIEQIENPNSPCVVNLPARLRMATLYAIAQNEGARVCNTCNRSEDIVGYSTLWGDSVGDFSPFGMLTTEEVVAIGDDLGVPYDLTHKTPSDGLCGKTDEENLGFTYNEINKIIRNGEHTENFDKIIARFEKNRFKLDMIKLPKFNPNITDYFIKNYGV